MLRIKRIHMQRGFGRIGIIAAAVVVIAIVALSATFVYESDETPPAADGPSARDLPLASEGAPTLGDPNAKVHLVEFLDPACETCAMFFPMVKNWMSQVPGQIRLSVRHVAFHDGAEHATCYPRASRAMRRFGKRRRHRCGSSPCREQKPEPEREEAHRGASERRAERVRGELGSAPHHHRDDEHAAERVVRIDVVSREESGNHQSLNVMSVPALESLTDDLPKTVHLGLTSPVKIGQRMIRSEGIAF